MEIKNNIILKLWDLSHVIVAFSAAQSLVFLYALNDSQFITRLKTTPLFAVVLAALILGGLGYFYAVIWCHRRMKILIPAENGEKEDGLSTTVKNAKNGRLIVIAFFTLFTVVILIGIRVGIFETPSPGSFDMRVTAEKAGIYLQPASDSKVIGSLPPGAEMDAAWTDDEWLEVKLPPDKEGIVITGYVHKNDIEERKRSR